MRWPAASLTRGASSRPGASHLSFRKTGLSGFANSPETCKSEGALLSQNAQMHEPACEWCYAYLKSLCQQLERILIVEIKIMFSNFFTD
jgi:hypothetical protein